MLPSEQKEYYKKEAEHHADFLCDKVFKPAFIMAFIHGVKHGREDEKRLHDTTFLCNKCANKKTCKDCSVNVKDCTDFSER